MSVRTYRAKTMQDALALVRRELGPRASVLRTREVRGGGGLLAWLGGNRAIEVVASNSVSVPSRLPPRRGGEQHALAEPGRPTALATTSASRPTAASRLPAQPSAARAPILVARSSAAVPQMPAAAGESHDSWFRLFADLLDAEVSEDLARELIERVRSQAPADEQADLDRLKARLAALVEAEIPIAGPIRLATSRRLVALVGPTGVGKTTTIAKLAANFRLREKRRVGLITVDTYRVAAVEQLRTYADIMDLPMEIVATPREMHQALARMTDVEVILMDTAGRSPRDEVRIQELKSMLAEAAPDEVHLVLSSVASGASLAKTAERFAAVGTTSLVLTKLDEAASLGNVLPLARASRLPLSYLTHGQNVPDDIAAAEAPRLARMILGLEPLGGR